MSVPDIDAIWNNVILRYYPGLAVNHGAFENAAVHKEWLRRVLDNEYFSYAIRGQMLRRLMAVIQESGQSGASFMLDIEWFRLTQDKPELATSQYYRNQLYILMSTNAELGLSKEEGAELRRQARELLREAFGVDPWEESQPWLQYEVGTPV